MSGSRPPVSSHKWYSGCESGKNMNTCDYIMCYSPHPRKGLVLFRPNSKEIPSQSTRWKHNHNAVWNERISIHSDVNFSQICTQNPILMSMSNRYGTKRAFISNFVPRVSLFRCNAEMSYRAGICATCSDYEYHSGWLKARAIETARNRRISAP